MKTEPILSSRSLRLSSSSSVEWGWINRLPRSTPLPMAMKLCVACGGSFAGGDFCPACGPRERLIDMASPEGRAMVQGSDEMKLAVMTHFAERRGMVRSVLMFLVGVGAGAMTLRFAFGAEDAVSRAGWILAALIVFFGCAWAGIRHAFALMRAQNQGTDFYECVDEEKPLRYVPTRKGMRWTTW
jgi:hypothetical protein